MNGGIEGTARTAVITPVVVGLRVDCTFGDQGGSTQWSWGDDSGSNAFQASLDNSAGHTYRGCGHLPDPVLGRQDQRSAASAYTIGGGATRSGHELGGATAAGRYMGSAEHLVAVDRRALLGEGFGELGLFLLRLLRRRLNDLGAR